MSSSARAGGGGRSSSTATVGKNHPAVAAASRLKKRNREKAAATPSARASPSRAAKTQANEKIHDLCHHDARPPVALEVVDSDDPYTKGVVVNSLPFAAAAGVSVADDVPAAVSPPTWNAWWCNSCTAQHYVGDGGKLQGPCVQCQVPKPIRNSIMLDPDEVEAVKKTPGLPYAAPFYSPQTGDPTTGMESDASPSFSITNSIDGFVDDFEDDLKTDAEVSRYSFFDRLEHYMEHVPISSANRKTVELTIMVEAGSNVREMATMNKDSRELAFHREYLTLIGDIDDERFTDDGVRRQMQTVFKGARKKEMCAGTLYRMYESQMTLLKKYAYKFPGVGSLSQLPSGTTQLQQMKKPLIMAAWKKKFPVRHRSSALFFSRLTNSHNRAVI